MEAILHIKSLNMGLDDRTQVFWWLNSCLISRKSKYGLITPLTYSSTDSWKPPIHVSD